MNDEEISKKEKVTLGFLAGLWALGIMGKLIYEDSITSASDPNRWFHQGLFAVGLIIISVCIPRFMPFVAFACSPFARGTFPDRSGLSFRNFTHAANWFLFTAFGLGLILFEFQVEENWFRSLSGF